MALTPTNGTCADDSMSISAAITGTPLSDLQISIDGGDYAAVISSPVNFSSLTAGEHIVVLRRISDITCSVTKKVTVSGPTNCSHLFPTGTDCSDYLDPTIVDTLVLEEVCLTTSGGTITNGTPGVFFFYGDFPAVKGENTITVDQIVPDGMQAFSVLNTNNLWIFDSNCNSQRISVVQNGEDWIITFRAKQAGTFVVSVKYDVKSLIGTSAPDGPVNYLFGIDGVGASYGSITVRDCSAPSASITSSAVNTSVQAESLSIETVENDVNVSPVPFDEEINVSYDLNYTSDVTIEIFDFGGNLLRTVKDSNVSKGSSTSIGVDFSIGANQMYLLRVTTDREQFVKQIVSSKK